MEELFATLEAAVKTDVEAFLSRENGNAQDFETLLQTVHRRALATASQSREGGFSAAFVVAFAAEVATLLGPRRADAQDFEVLEPALRRRALDLAARALAQYFNTDDADPSDSTVAWVVSPFETETLPSRAPVAEGRATLAAARRPSSRRSGR